MIERKIQKADEQKSKEKKSSMPFDLGGNLGEDKVTFESNLQSSGLWMQSVPKPIKKIEVQLRTVKHVKSGGLVIIARKLFVHYRKKSFVSVLRLKPLG